MTPTPCLESFWGRPQAPDKLLDEQMGGQGVGVNRCRGLNFDPHPPTGHFVAQDIVWSPGAAPKIRRAGGGGHPGARLEGVGSPGEL